MAEKTREFLKTIADAVESHAGNITGAARQLGMHRETVRRYYREAMAAGVESSPPSSPPSTSDQIQADRQLRQSQARMKSAQDKYASLLKDHEDAEARLEAMTAISSHVDPVVIRSKKKTSKAEACAIVQASDWHVGERVDPSTVNWINEYNPDIATKRAKRFFTETLRLVRQLRNDREIKTLVLALSGDIITGYIHEELMENNYLSPTEEVLLAQDLIAGGLQLLLDEGEFDRIIVPCNPGNHGRTSIKMKASTSYKNSYEWMMYRSLASYFDKKGDGRLQFEISNGYFTYVQVFDRQLRFHHGDAIRYMGGVGGVTVPLLRFIGQTNKQRWADLDSIGHFHQRTPFAQWTKFQINGSLIGFGAYSQRIAASPEPPMQNFQILEAEKGFTVSAPILVED